MSMLKKLVLLLLLNGCSGPQIIPLGTLDDQILIAVTGHEGKLINQTCAEYKKNECVRKSIVEYDMNDATFRANARLSNFVCKIGDKQYIISADQPGFIRNTYSCNWFTGIFGGCQKNVEYLPASPTSSLIDGKIQCFDPNKYSWDAM